MKLDLTRIYDRIVAMDTVEDAEQRFDTARARGGLAWAIDNCGDAVLKARALARVVRPIIGARDGSTDDEWITMIRIIRNDQMRQLLGTWQHASSRWTAEASTEFVRQLEYVLD